MQELQTQLREAQSASTSTGPSPDQSAAIAAVEARCAELDAEAASLREQLAASLAESSAAGGAPDHVARVTELEAELALKRDELAGLSKAADRANKEGEGLRAEIARLKGEIVDFKEQADALRTEQKTSLAAASDKAAKTKSRFDSVAAGFKSKIKVLQEENAALAEAREQAQQVLCCRVRCSAPPSLLHHMRGVVLSQRGVDRHTLSC